MLHSCLRTVCGLLPRDRGLDGVAGVYLGEVFLQEEMLEGELLDRIERLAVLRPGQAAAELGVVVRLVRGEVLVHDTYADVWPEMLGEPAQHRRLAGVRGRT